MKRFPISCAVLAAVCYGISAPVAKILLEDMPPAFMAAMLYLGAGIGMAAITAFIKRPSGEKEARITKKELPYTVAMVALDIAAPILLMLGLTMTTSATASLLNNFEIAATAVIALAFFKEAVGKRMWLAIALITVSAMLLSIEDFSTLALSPGSVFVLLACVCWGIENNCTSRLSLKNPLQIVVIKGLGSGLGALLIAMLTGGGTTNIPYIVIALLLGFIAIFIIHRIPYQSYLKYTRLLFGFAIVLMLLTFFVGVSSNEATRSLRLGGVTFQPADFVKITLIMTLAKALTRRQKGIEKQDLLPRVKFGMTDRDRERNRHVWHENSIPLLAPVALSCGLIFFSNFSTAALLFLTCLVMMYVGRIRVGELWRLVRTVVLTVVLAVAVMYPLDIGRARVWVGRLTSFAGVEQVDKASTVDERSDNQVLNAKMSIASGGVIGRGPGQSVQRTNLALPFSDYAYAFIAEEYGLAGCMVVLALYLWLFFRTTVIFRTCEKTFPGLLVLGLGILIVLQALVSMLVAVDLFPVTGLPLPLVSLGGSSILFTSIALGMILGISRQMQEKTIDEENANI